MFSSSYSPSPSNQVKFIYLKELEERRRQRNEDIRAKIQQLKLNSALEASRSELLRQMQDEYKALMQKYLPEKKLDHDQQKERKSQHVTSYFQSISPTFNAYKYHTNIKNDEERSIIVGKSNSRSNNYVSIGINTVLTGPVVSIQPEINSTKEIHVKDDERNALLNDEDDSCANKLRSDMNQIKQTRELEHNPHLLPFPRTSSIPGIITTFPKNHGNKLLRNFPDKTSDELMFGEGKAPFPVDISTTDTSTTTFSKDFQQGKNFNENRPVGTEKLIPHAITKLLEDDEEETEASISLSAFSKTKEYSFTSPFHSGKTEEDESYHFQLRKDENGKFKENIEKITNPKVIMVENIRKEYGTVERNASMNTVRKESIENTKVALSSDDLDIVNSLVKTKEAMFGIQSITEEKQNEAEIVQKKEENSPGSISEEDDKEKLKDEEDKFLKDEKGRENSNTDASDELKKRISTTDFLPLNKNDRFDPMNLEDNSDLSSFNIRENTNASLHKNKHDWIKVDTLQNTKMEVEEGSLKGRNEEERERKLHSSATTFEGGTVSDIDETTYDEDEDEVGEIKEEKLVGNDEREKESLLDSITQEVGYTSSVVGTSARKMKEDDHLNPHLCSNESNQKNSVNPKIKLRLGYDDSSESSTDDSKLTKGTKIQTSKNVNEEEDEENNGKINNSIRKEKDAVGNSKQKKDGTSVKKLEESDDAEVDDDLDDFFDL